MMKSNNTESKEAKTPAISDGGMVQLTQELFKWAVGSLKPYQATTLSTLVGVPVSIWSIKPKSYMNRNGFFILQIAVRILGFRSFISALGAVKLFYLFSRTITTCKEIIFHNFHPLSFKVLLGFSLWGKANPSIYIISSFFKRNVYARIEANRKAKSSGIKFVKSTFSESRLNIKSTKANSGTVLVILNPKIKLHQTRSVYEIK